MGNSNLKSVSLDTPLVDRETMGIEFAENTFYWSIPSRATSNLFQFILFEVKTIMYRVEKVWKWRWWGYARENDGTWSMKCLRWSIASWWKRLVLLRVRVRPAAIILRLHFSNEDHQMAKTLNDSKWIKSRDPVITEGGGGEVRVKVRVRVRVRVRVWVRVSSQDYSKLLTTIVSNGA